MKKNALYTLSIIGVSLVLAFIYACSSQQEDKSKSYISCKLDGSDIMVDVDTFTIYKYYLNVGTVLVDSGRCTEHKVFTLPQIIKGAAQKRKEIALNAAKNNYVHKIRLQINDVVDTMFEYRQSLTEILDDNISFAGFGAPLVRKSHKTDIEKELRVWLYRKGEHIDDSLFNIFRLIYSELSFNGDNEYIPVGNIPVVHDINGYKYKVKSSIQADYYAIVACQGQAFIDQFIEQVVGNNFAGISTSLSTPLICHYKKGTSGYRNVFLLCINKDWSYKQFPLATFALDNSAPESHFYDDSGSPYRSIYNHHNNNTSGMKEPTSLSYDNRIKVLYPESKPKIYGGALVSITNWDGNGLECNVTFCIELNGDAKSATIQRRGDLCFREYGGGYYFRQEDKVIYAKDHKEPYTFTYKMHFDNGDNIIPVIVEDYNGNKYKGSITVKAQFVRDNTPSINIDNNIDIYN